MLHGWRALTAGACLLMLAGCSTSAGLAGAGMPTAQLAALTVMAEPMANNDSATAVDIVFVYELPAVGSLPKTAPEWFTRKPELLQAFPNALEVTSLQVPPATARMNVPLPRRHERALHVVAYVNYLSKAGQAAINLTPLKYPLLQLQPEAVVVNEL